MYNRNNKGGCTFSVGPESGIELIISLKAPPQSTRTWLRIFSGCLILSCLNCAKQSYLGLDAEIMEVQT